MIHDGSDELRVVLWGETALLPSARLSGRDLQCPRKARTDRGYRTGRGEGQRDPVAQEVPQPITFRDDPAGPGMHLHR